MPGDEGAATSKAMETFNIQGGAHAPGACMLCCPGLTEAGKAQADLDSCCCVIIALADIYLGLQGILIQENARILNKCSMSLLSARSEITARGP